MMKLRIVLIPLALFIALFGLSSCGSQPESGSPEGNASAASFGSLPAGGARLGNGSASPDILVREALGGLSRGDTAALLRLLVSEREFQNHIYPEFGIHYPAARDTGAQARRFVWENHSLGALKALRKVMRELGGRRLELRSVTFPEGTKRFNSYALHEGTTVKVRLEDGGEADLLAFGSIVEMDGVYKLLSYRDRE